MPYGAELYSIFKGEVVSVQDYGIFVKIPGSRKNGLVHKSQMSNVRIETPSEMASKGDSVYCKVISVEEDGEKIALSMKVVNQTSGKDEDANNVQLSLDEKRRKQGFQREIPKIELGAIFNTTCVKCGAKGHMAKDCFHQPGSQKYDLIPEEVKEPSFFGAELPENKNLPKKEKKMKKEKKKKMKKEKKSKKRRESSDSESEEEARKMSEKKKKKKKKKNRKRERSSSPSSSSSDSGPARDRFRGRRESGSRQETRGDKRGLEKHPSPRSRRSRSPVQHQMSRSPVHKQRSRSPIQSRRSRSNVQHRRSISPEQRRTRSPVCRQRSRSPVRRQRSRSPVRRQRSRSPVRRQRSRSPVQRSRVQNRVDNRSRRDSRDEGRSRGDRRRRSSSSSN